MKVNYDKLWAILCSGIINQFKEIFTEKIGKINYKPEVKIHQLSQEKSFIQD